MSSTYGDKVRVSVFGESHGENVGAVVDGLPAGFKIDTDKLRIFMDRRAPGGDFVTERKESDKVRIVSGLYKGRTADSPLCILIDNNDTKSEDYGDNGEIPRPGHGDYTSYVHSGGFADFRGGGHGSGRLTAPLCAAGNIIMQILESEYHIKIYGRLLSVGNAEDEIQYTDNFDGFVLERFERIKNGAFPVLNEEAEGRIKEKIQSVKGRDSLGGVVQCVIFNVPAGIGEPIFDGIENRIASAVFGIPGVKGIEFGKGFYSSKLKGTEMNDPFCMKNGEPATETNNCGGILGGRSDGMPVVFNVAFKPTPSIPVAQKTINVGTGVQTEKTVTGRHDPCIALRAVPAVEAAAALAIADFLI